VPIDIDQFEQHSEGSLREAGRTNAEQILSFLAANPEHAYTPKEIHTAIDVPRGSVGVVLSRLEDRDLVRHRGEYWAIGTAEDIDTTLQAMATAQTATDRLGDEDPAAWGDGIDDDSTTDR
jgi:hypothetical protein